MEQLPQPTLAEGRQPHEQAFNLGVLSTDHVLRLNRALCIEKDEWADAIQAGGTLDRAESGVLLGLLKAAIEALAAEDLDRAKEIVRALKNDRSALNEGYGYSQELAAHCAPTFVPFDYEFARDTLLDIEFSSDGTYNDGCAWETAMSVGNDLQQRLPPELSADFERHWQQRDDAR